MVERVRRLLVLVSAVVLVDMTFYAAIAPLLPQYQQDLGLSKSAAGGLTAAYAAGTLIASLPAGRLAGWVGGKPTLLLGLGLLAVSSLAFGFGTGLPVLDGARFAQGVGGACTWAGGFAWLVAATALALFWTPAAAMLSESSESAGLDQGLAFGLMNLAWALGQVVGGAAGGSLADAAGDGVSYSILGVLCAATLLLTVRTGEQTTAAP